MIGFKSSPTIKADILYTITLKGLLTDGGELNISYTFVVRDTFYVYSVADQLRYGTLVTMC